MPDILLIVDDDIRLATAMLARLRAEGFDPAHADCARTALEAAYRMRPSVVVLDIRLPDMDGYEVCKRLRATPSLCQTPIVFLSGNSTPEDRRRALQAGGNAFCAKPCPHGELVAAIRELLLTREASGSERLGPVCDPAPTRDQLHTTTPPVKEAA